MYSVEAERERVRRKKKCIILGRRGIKKGKRERENKLRIRR